MIEPADLAMRETLLRIASENDRIKASDLWQRASRERWRMTPFAIAAMWELVGEGLLDYDASATVRAVGQREVAP